MRPLLAALVVALLASPAPAKEAAAPAKVAPRPQGIFFTATKGDRTLYLLGSVHVAAPSFYPLAAPVEAAFAASKTLVVEADVEAATKPEAQALLLKAGSYAGTDGLQKKLPAPVYADAKAHLAKLGADIRTLDRFKPWMVASLIIASTAAKLGFDAKNGVDAHYLALARGRKQVVELEGVAGQAALFSGLSDADQARFLAFSMADGDVMEQELTRMITAWKAGDAAAIEAMIEAPLKKDPDLAPLMEALFDRRNEAMAARLAGLSPGKAFVVVGAGHLLGKAGIPARLRAEGWTVEPR